LARIFELVQGLVGLGTKDHRDPLKNAAHEMSGGPSRLRFRAAGAAHRLPPYLCSETEHSEGGE
jgi:hypothetical protein